MSEEIGARELELLAAEAALGLLSDSEMAAAEALAAEDAAFRASCAAWVTRFAGLFDDLRAQRPTAAVSARIKTLLLGDEGAEGDRFITVVLNEEADEAAAEERGRDGEGLSPVTLKGLAAEGPAGARGWGRLSLLPWVGVGLVAAAGLLWVVDRLVAA